MNLWILEIGWIESVGLNRKILRSYKLGKIEIIILEYGEKIHLKKSTLINYDLFH